MKTVIFIIVCVFLQSTLADIQPQQLRLPKQCEDVLPVKTCRRLGDAAVRLVLTGAALTTAIGEALYAGKEKVEDIVEYVEEYIVQNAINFKCESVMNPQECKGLDIIGNRLALGAATVTMTIRRVVVESILTSRQIYDKTRSMLKELAKNTSCETILNAEKCKLIVDVAKRLRLKAEDATNAVKEAIIEGAASVQAIFTKSVEYLKEQFTCEKALKKSTCDKIRGIADKFSVSLKAVNKYLRNAVANGIVKTSELISSAMKFIADKWNGLLGDETNFDDYSAIQTHLYWMVADL